VLSSQEIAGPDAGAGWLLLAAAAGCEARRVRSGGYRTQPQARQQFFLVSAQGRGGRFRPLDPVSEGPASRFQYQNQLQKSVLKRLEARPQSCWRNGWAQALERPAFACSGAGNWRC